MTAPPLKSSRLARYLVGLRDGTHGTFERVADGVPFLSAKNVQAGGVVVGDESMVSRQDASAIVASGYPARGDVLLTIVGSVGRSAVYDAEEPLPFQRSVAFLRPDLHRLNPSYLSFQLQSKGLQDQIALATKTSAQPGLYLGEVGSLEIEVPPVEKQRAIAAYLDRETARIDRLIGEQRRLIDLLDERRQAVIESAVGRGLNDATPTKPSGLFWTPTVPSHWTVGNIRKFATMKTGHTPSRSTAEYWTSCTIPWFTLADVWQLRDGSRKYLGETANRISELGLANSAAELLPSGTVVLSRTASVGFSGIMPTRMATSQDFWNWIPGSALDAEYLLWTFRAMHSEFQSLMIGSTHKTIYQPTAAAFRIPVPPLDEQRRIAAFVDTQVKKIDTLVAETERFIELVRERRSALITAAVSGQFDVPEVA